MKPFKNFISENSFYTLQSEKDAFLADEKMVMGAFFFGFIGPIAFLDGAKNKQKIRAYFMSDKKLRLQTIDDSNNDTSLIIKIMNDKGFFKTPATANEVTRFLVKARSGQIDDIDPLIIRGWIESIKADKLQLLNPVVKKELASFMDGNTTLVSFGETLRSNAARFPHLKTTEFFTTTKAMQIEPSKKSVTPAATAVTSTAATVTPSTPSAPSPATNTKDGIKGKDAKDSSIVKPVAVKPPKEVKPVKQPWPGSDLFYIELVNGKDVSSYKYIAKDARDFLEFVLLKITRTVSDSAEEAKAIKDTAKTIEWIKKSISNPNPVISSWYTGQGYGNTSLRRIRLACQSGLWDLWVESPSNNVSAKLIKVFQSVFSGLMYTVQSGSRKDSLTEIDNLIDLYRPFIKFYRENNYYNDLSNRISSDYFYTSGDKDLFITFSISNKKSSHWVSSITSVDGKILCNPTYPLTGADRAILDKFRITQLGNVDQLLVVPSSSSQVYQFRKDFWEKVSKFTPVEHKDFLDKLGRKSATELKQWADNVLRIDGSILGQWISNNVLMNFLRGIMKILPNETILDNIRFAEKFAEFPKDISDRIADLLFEPTRRSAEKIKDPYEEKIYEFMTGAINNSKIDNKLKNQYLDWFIFRTSQFNIDLYYYILNSWPGFNENPKILSNINLSKEDNHRIHDVILKAWEGSHSAIRYDKFPIYTYSNLTAADRKRFVAAFDTTKNPRIYDGMVKWIDDVALKDMPSESITVDIIVDSDLTDKQEKFNQLIQKNPGVKENIFSPKSTTVTKYKKLMQLTMNSKEINNQEFGNFIDKSMNSDWGKQSSSTKVFLSIINSSDGHMTTKSQIAFEKLMRNADENANKLESSYQNLVPIAQESFLKYIESNRAGAQDFYISLGKSLKRRLATAYLSNKDFGASAADSLRNSNSPIKPFEQLTNQRIKEILKYNNVSSEESKLPDKILRDFTTMDLYVKTHTHKPLEDLQVTEIATKNNELEQISADLHRTKRSNRHGRVGIIINRMFTVAIPKQVKEQDSWIKNNPSQEIIHPMFHGTGSIAASMILRYGWAVIKSGDSSVAGRMLGDGIYAAIHIDKAQQYLGDGNFNQRKIGTKGYMFEINGALGEKNKDYRAMGLGTDHIRSPEWCVFTPNSQYKIVRAFEVRIASESEIEELLRKYPRSNRTLYEKYQLQRLRKFIKEESERESENVNYTTFTFISADLPVGAGVSVDFEKFKGPNKNITFEPTAYGPSIVVKNTHETNNYMYTSPIDLEMNYPEQFEELMRYYRGEGFTFPPG